MSGDKRKTGKIGKLLNSRLLLSDRVEQVEIGLNRRIIRILSKRNRNSEQSVRRITFIEKRRNSVKDRKLL